MAKRNLTAAHGVSSFILTIQNKEVTNIIGIYKIQNNINQKNYIGQSKNIEMRWKQHIYNAESGSQYPIHRALRKYGVEKFSFSILEVCKTSELNDKEIEWIAKFNSYEEGYNCTRGGDGYLKIDYEQILSLWNEGKGAKEISEIAGIASSHLTSILHSFDISKKEIRERSKNYMRKPVEQYDFSGKLIASYSCAEEAENLLGINAHNIQSVCQRQPQYKSAGGFLWKYADDDVSIEFLIARKNTFENLQQKTVYQYLLSGELLGEYRSTGEASRCTGVAQQNISLVCRGKREKAGGYIWSYTKL